MEPAPSDRNLTFGLLDVFVLEAALDRDLYHGMGVSVGRLREDTLFDYKFVGLSHNTLCGAAGGAVLIAELLFREGYLTAK